MQTTLTHLKQPVSYVQRSLVTSNNSMGEVWVLPKLEINSLRDEVAERSDFVRLTSTRRLSFQW